MVRTSLILPNYHLGNLDMINYEFNSPSRNTSCAEEKSSSTSLVENESQVRLLWWSAPCLKHIFLNAGPLRLPWSESWQFCSQECITKFVSKKALQISSKTFTQYILIHEATCVRVSVCTGHSNRETTKLVKDWLWQKVGLTEANSSQQWD